MTAAQQWLDGAADDYYERNRADFGKNDIVTPMLKRYDLRGQRVLEIGCADGWRLKILRDEFGCQVTGLDPSKKAIDAALAAGIDGRVGSAEALPFADGSFDLVIFGYCLWFIEPGAWFKVAAEADRVLVMDGNLIIHDFAGPRPVVWRWWQGKSQSERELNCSAWLYDFRQLFLGHPWYMQVVEHGGGRKIGEVYMLEVATLLHKGWTKFYHVEKADVAQGPA